MKIGIDIDDTITNTWEVMIPYCSKLYKIDESVLKKSNPYYQSVKDKVSLAEYCKDILPITEKVVLDIPLKKDVPEVIKRLRAMHHQIIFITSRSSIDMTNPYQKTVEYLNNHQIEYDKLIVAKNRKDLTCLEEGIELFIDDSNNHCDRVSNVGIDVLMFETEYNKHNLRHKHVSSWKEIEDYILRGNKNER